MVKEPLTEAQVWELLSQVTDPEIPVVSLVEMGIARRVAVDGAQVHVTLTPTFTGCPALQVMAQEVERRLRDAGAAQVRVEWALAPAWTSDWITPEGREKLRRFGLAPPPLHRGRFEAALLQVVACPHCGSLDTTLQNSFGPTLCRAIFTCNACRQPFEQIKPI